MLGLVIFMDETRKDLNLRFDWFGFTALAVAIAWPSCLRQSSKATAATGSFSNFETAASSNEAASAVLPFQYKARPQALWKKGSAGEALAKASRSAPIARTSCSILNSDVVRSSNISGCGSIW